MEAQIVELSIKYFPLIITVLLGLPVAMIFLAVQLWRYGGDIRRLNRFETIAQLAHFADNQKGMTTAFGAATAASAQMKQACERALADLESLRDYVAEMQEKISERDADEIMKQRLEEQGDEAKEDVPVLQGLSPGSGERSERVNRGVLWSRPTEEQPSDADALYRSTMVAWDRFLTVLRARLEGAGIAPMMNRIGKMTYALTDRRRRSPLPLETAELIAALNSQYRRFTRMQGRRAEWMNRQVHDDFVRLVETAIRELTPPEGDGPTNGSRRAQHDGERERLL